LSDNKIDYIDVHRGIVTLSGRVENVRGLMRRVIQMAENTHLNIFIEIFMYWVDFVF